MPPCEAEGELHGFTGKKPLSTEHRTTDQPAKTIGILQPGYLPWLGFFEQLHRSDVFVLYDDVQFEKGSWRNRNRIKGPKGPQWLTVPVLTKGLGLPVIKDVLINQSRHWQKKHTAAIRQSYSKAPYFKQYSEPIFHILNRPWKYLIDLDLELIGTLKERMGISTPVLLSSDLHIEGKGVERLIDIIRYLGGSRFYEGQAGKNYIEAELFEKEDIQVVFQDYQHPRYLQANGDFISHLSIIDLLFNCGPESLKILSGV